MSTTSPTIGAQCCDPGNSASPANVNSFPHGVDKQIGGLDCYVVGEGNKAAVIIATDIYGYTFPNIRANADEIAAAGFEVIVPDLFNKDPISIEQWKDQAYVFQTWWPKHEPQATHQYVIAVAQALKKEGKVRSIQAVGYCYGCTHVLALFKQQLAISGVVNHPAGFSKDNVELCTQPLLVNCAERDTIFTPDIRAHWEKTLKEKKAPAKFIEYPNTDHGFGVRDDGSPNGVTQRKRALAETIAFLKQGAAVGAVIGVVTMGGEDEGFYVGEHPAVEVMNGIAWDQGTGRLFTTGKLWPWLYEVRLANGTTWEMDHAAPVEEQLRRVCPTSQWTEEDAHYTQAIIN